MDLVAACFDPWWRLAGMHLVYVPLCAVEGWDKDDPDPNLGLSACLLELTLVSMRRPGSCAWELWQGRIELEYAVSNFICV